jgi:trans-2,3-dihydro-3-hydroxyanthranilate isomerase
MRRCYGVASANVASRFRYRIVDVFTDRPLAGNALCVVLDPCDEAVMQAIAREANLSETTFPEVTGPAAYRMRIFNPRSEMSFAGHPSLGTAWTLGPNTWTQTTSGAVVTIEADAHGARMSQPDPAFDAVDPAPAVAAVGVPSALGAWRGTAGALTHLYVLTDAPIGDLDVDLGAIVRVNDDIGALGLALVNRLDDAMLYVRVFGPGSGIPEDPGTGSAAGPIGLLAREHWGTDVDVLIRQGDEVGRPCRIEVHAEPGAVRVGGRVSACAEGVFTL